MVQRELSEALSLMLHSEFRKSWNATVHEAIEVDLVCIALGMRGKAASGQDGGATTARGRAAGAGTPVAFPVCRLLFQKFLLPGGQLVSGP